MSNSQVQDDNNTYTLKDSSFIKNKYGVLDDPAVGYSDYSLENNMQSPSLATSSDLTPLKENDKLISKNFNLNMMSFYITRINNNTGAKSDLENTLESPESMGNAQYVFGQDGKTISVDKFIKENNVISSSNWGWQNLSSIVNSISNNNKTVPKDSSINGFYFIDEQDNFDYQGWNLIKKENGLTTKSSLGYVGNLSINFHFVDVGYEQSSN